MKDKLIRNLYIKIGKYQILNEEIINKEDIICEMVDDGIKNNKEY